MVDQVYQPDAVFERLRRLTPISRLLGAEPSVGFRLPEEAMDLIEEVYGTRPFHSSSSAISNVPADETWRHDGISLDLSLFRVYYLAAAQELGDQQSAVYWQTIQSFRSNYAGAEGRARRTDFYNRVRTLIGYYRRVLDIYDFLRMQTRPDIRQLSREAAEGVLQTTGILLPPRPDERQGRPRVGSRRSLSERGAEVDPSRIWVTITDFNNLKEEIYDRHPLFAFIFNNQTLHRTLSSLAYSNDSPGRASIEELIDQAISALLAARNVFRRELLREEWANIQPLLDMTKMEILGPEAESPWMYNLARQIDENVTTSSSPMNLALMVLGIVSAAATGGLSVPVVLMIEVALTAVASVEEVHQILEVERRNRTRAEISGLAWSTPEYIDLATAQEDLAPHLYLMIASLAVAPALVIARPVLSLTVRAGRRVRGQVASLVRRASTPPPSRVPHRGTVRRRTGGRGTGRRGTGRRGTIRPRERNGQVEEGGPNTGTQGPARSRRRRHVPETSLPSGRELIGQRNGARYYLSHAADGTPQLWRCDD